jgi:hypothetical protein
MGSPGKRTTREATGVPGGKFIWSIAEPRGTGFRPFSGFRPFYCRNPGPAAMPLSADKPTMSSPGRITALLNHRDVQLLMLLAFALLFNREGDRVPSGNEWIYLLYVYKAWHPAFLAGDWTFLEPTAGHAIFNWVAGLATLIPAKSPAQSLSVVAWTGRFFCWTACFIALQRLARRFSIPPWLGCLGIVLWLTERQSLVTTEWIVGTFEAKCVAYACLLFAIDFAIDGKLWRAGVLTGLAFTFHTAVGMWGGAALGVAVLLNSRVKKTVQFSAFAILFSLPGLITSLPLVLGAHAIRGDDSKFLVTMELPGALDPATFPRIWPVVMFGLLGFGAAHAAWRWDRRGVRMLFQIEAATGLFFLFGVTARLMHRFDWVQLYPLRVFSVIVMLLFFWQFLDAAWTALVSTGPARPRAVVLLPGIAAFVCLPAPGVVLFETLRSHVRHVGPTSGGKWDTAPNDDGDFRNCAVWIADHTATDILVISPPWRNDAYYLMQRPLVVDWHAPRYDRMTEWKSRIEAMTGPIEPDRTWAEASRDLPTNPSENLGPQARAFYAGLTAAQVEQLHRDYGRSQVAYLVTPSEYPFTPVFRSGGMTVYRLPDIKQ